MKTGCITRNWSESWLKFPVPVIAAINGHTEAKVVLKACNDDEALIKDAMVFAGIFAKNRFVFGTIKKLYNALIVSESNEMITINNTHHESFFVPLSLNGRYYEFRKFAFLP